MNTNGKGWFNDIGELTKSLPADCINDCAAMGRVDDAVAYWVEALNFEENFPADKARAYLAEFGAWERDELERMSTNELAQKVLWILCGYVKEGETYLTIQM